MRIRRRKHLEERLANINEFITVADKRYSNVNEAIRNKSYIDFELIFNNKNHVDLEIGCGKGRFISNLAKNNLDVNYLAVEKLENIILLAAEKASSFSLNNLRFINSGAEYLPRYIRPNSISNIYLNFSPPFPCKRDENKRLTNQTLVNNYKMFLKSGGCIFLRTDDKDFFEYSMANLISSGFLVEDDSDKQTNDNYVMTEYEEKFTQLGMKIYKLTAKLV